MTQFKVYASKDNDGQVVGATVIAYDNEDKTVEKITVLDAEEITAINEHLEDIDATLLEKSDVGHDHDDRYYTESEINNKISTINGEFDAIDEELELKSDVSHNHDSSYYSKTYIDDLENDLLSAIGNIVSFDTVVVDELPSTGVKGVFYFIPKNGSTDENNVYEEYIWIATDNKYELVGSTAITVNLDNYYTKEEVDDLIDVLTSPEGDYYTKNEINSLIESKANSTHSHVISDVTGLQDALDGKLDDSLFNNKVYSLFDEMLNDVSGW